MILLFLDLKIKEKERKEKKTLGDSCLKLHVKKVLDFFLHVTLSCLFTNALQ